MAPDSPVAMTGPWSAGEERLSRQGPGPILYALVALALAAPLAFGAVADWAWATAAGVCGMLLLGWGALALGGRRRVVRPPRFLCWAASAFALVMLWAVLQTVGFTPESWHHALWRDAAEALGTPYRGAVSLDPGASRESVLRILSYTGVFWLAFQHGHDPRHVEYVLRAVALGSACYALYGLAVLFSGAEMVLWVEKTQFQDAVTATFINPNSFATYAGMGLLCATGALWHRVTHGFAGVTGVRARLHFLLGEALPNNALLLAAWLVLATALLLSLSRAGIAATALALFVFLCIAGGRRGLRLRTLALRLTGFVLVGAVLLALAGEGLERRLRETAPDWAKRAQIYSLTMTAIEQRPLLGTGLGTYAAVYRSHRTEGVRRGVRMAHNDYLELALELGIPAAFLFVAAIATTAFGCARGLRAQAEPDTAFPAVGLAVCMLVGAHALLDFSLQVPAVAITFALLFGVAVAQVQPPPAEPRP